MSKKNGPDPDKIFPFAGLGYEIDPKRTCFLKNCIKRENIEVGEYTYYDDPNGVENFEKNVIHDSGSKLIIGKFCAIATGVQFILGAANHKLDGLSTYPFPLFKCGWGEGFDFKEFPHKGDTIIGNDVWIGHQATIMPGVTVGDGAVIGTKAVVTKNVEPFSIVGGNPAKLIRQRFDDETTDQLLSIQWWNWPIDKISRNVSIIMGANIEKLINAK